jgi:hypothetical protein
MSATAPEDRNADAARATAAVAEWLRVAAGLAPDAPVSVGEEPHCPDASCALRRTVLEWRDPADGGTRRAEIIKPVVYVRRADVERAARVARAGG